VRFLVFARAARPFAPHFFLYRRTGEQSTTIQEGTEEAAVVAESPGRTMGKVIDGGAAEARKREKPARFFLDAVSRTA
jgi:hypothetical protein